LKAPPARIDAEGGVGNSQRRTQGLRKEPQNALLGQRDANRRWSIKTWGAGGDGPFLRREKSFGCTLRKVVQKGGWFAGQWGGNLTNKAPVIMRNPLHKSGTHEIWRLLNWGRKRERDGKGKGKVGVVAVSPAGWAGLTRGIWRGWKTKVMEGTYCIGTS